MSKAKMTPPTSSPGVIRKAKARWENVCKFIAPVVRPFNGRHCKTAEDTANKRNKERFE